MKKKKNTIPYRDIKDLPEDDWVRNLGPIIIYSTPSTKSSSETQSSLEEQEANPPKKDSM
jgi:hypothetical protein